jgi:hypothetical protein
VTAQDRQNSLGSGKGDLVGRTLPELTSGDDGDILGVEADVQVSGVSGRRVGLEHGPRSFSVLAVDVQLGIASGADDDRPIGTSHRGPDVARRSLGYVPIGRLDRSPLHAVERQRVLGDLVVHGELVIAVIGTTTVFVGHYVRTGRELVDDGHSGSSGVGGVPDVVDDSAPVLAVGGDLVDHLLTVSRVALKEGTQH